METVHAELVEDVLRLVLTGVATPDQAAARLVQMGRTPNQARAVVNLVPFAVVSHGRAKPEDAE